MKKKRRILYLTTEAAPFNPDSLLAELSRHLPKIFRTQGHDIRVVMPKYSFIRDRKYNLREVIRLREIPVPLRGILEWVSVKSGFIPDTRVQVYFLENEKFFEREGVINDPATGKPYPDNDERFIVFTRAVVEMLKILSWQPQIIHATDWTSGMVSFYLRKLYAKDKYYEPTRTVLSLVNCENIASFTKSTVFKAGIDPDSFEKGCDIELKGKFSFLKPAIMYSDVITTCGEGARSILPSDIRKWMSDYKKEHPEKFFNHFLGIDHSYWNPDKDEKIAANFSNKDLSGRNRNKALLVEKYSLEMDESAPLIGCIWDGGDFSALLPALEYIKSIGAALVIADKSASEDAAVEFVKNAPGKIGAVKLLTGLTIKQLISGTDIMLLHPGKYREQMHYKAMRYGSIPVAPNYGNYGDNIVDDADEGNGFLYKHNNPESMINALKKAVEMFRDEKNWTELMKRAMKLDVTWNRTSVGFSEVFDTLIGSEEE